MSSESTTSAATVEVSRKSLNARQLRAGGIHERRDGLDRLERHAAANATLAGLFRRTFMRGAR